MIQKRRLGLKGPFRHYMKTLDPLPLRTPGSLFEPHQGFTLIEIVVVIVILSIISGITLHFVVNSVRIYTLTVNQKTLLDEGKLALERMCRDIRDANTISSPASGGSGSSITMTRSHGTAHDTSGEDITFRLNGTTLEQAKTSPSATSALASNVSSFTVTRGGASDEIKIELTLSLATGERLTLQSKVYPKNLADSMAFKNFFGNWWEELST